VIEILAHVRDRRDMWLIRGTHHEVVALLVGIDAATGLFPGNEVKDWLRSRDPKGGYSSNWPWQICAAVAAVPDHPDDGGPRSYSADEEAAMGTAIIDVAIAWLRHRVATEVEAAET
jgi:hypothetical protein